MRLYSPFTPSCFAAENVQVSVLLGWLTELVELHRSKGRTADALACAQKALHHFGNDKGEQHALVRGA